MKVTIEFETNNAAFEDDFESSVRGILRQAANKVMAQVERTPATVCDAPENNDKLLDINGNTVGRVKVAR